MISMELNFHFFLIILFILIRIKLTYGQVIQPNFRSSDVELIPNLMVMNSTSRVHFFCTNHHPENLSLIVSLSRNISDKFLKLSTKQLNKTTMRITIHSKRYIGIFYLFCHVKTKEQRGTRADVIVKADAGLLRLAQRCRVYERKYIKCNIRASTLARAIKNGFSPEIEFTEMTNLRSYKEQYEFLKNESTNDYLVFRWEPTVNGQFPNDVKMNIKITLPFFGTSQYRFDMTPMFVIKPNFTVQILLRNKLHFQLIPNSPPAICQRHVQLKSNLTMNRTWIMIEASRPRFNIEKPLFNTIYQVCVRCRQTTNDSYSPEECQEINSTLKSS
ncbi:hypothetical protein I4U23_024707 [Adineta vaga]|nr:hypothetical protein I4U23_024707 [Adineta vaga]